MTKPKTENPCQEAKPEFGDELIGQLARRLPALWARLDALQCAQFALPFKSERWLFLENERSAVHDELSAIGDLILASRCGSIATAAIQVMLAAAALDSVNPDDEGERKLCRQAVHAVRVALPVIGKAAGLDLKSVAVDRYSPDYLDPYPRIDLSAATSDAV